MKKRLLSILLALALIVGIIPMSMMSASADVAEGGSGQGLQMPTPKNVQATLVGWKDASSGKALVCEISWDALSSDVDGGNKFVEMWPSLKQDANLSLPMSFEAWMGQATLIPVDELQEGGIGYVTKDGRSVLICLVHVLQEGELKVGEDGMANGVKENDVIDIDLYTAGYDPATQTDGESDHTHVEIVYTEENVKNKKTFKEAGAEECTHENTESTAEILNVKDSVIIDGKSTNVMILKDTEKCVDCNEKKTQKVYRLKFKSRWQMSRYLSGKNAKLKNGKSVHFKGKYEKVEKVFWNKKKIKISKAYNKKKGSVILEFTDDFLASVEDGTYELTVVNGDEFTAMTVTVQDHEMVELGAYDPDSDPAVTVDAYDALMQECEENGIEIIDCDLDAFYADGFMVNADDAEVTMNLSSDMTDYEGGDPVALPAVTLTSETGVEYAEDEDYTLTFYQITYGENGEPNEVEIDREQITESGDYLIVAMPTRNGVLYGEAQAQFSVIEHDWEWLSDEDGHWKHCKLCDVSFRIVPHEYDAARCAVKRVEVPVDSDFEETNLLCVTVWNECGVCGYQTPVALYNVAFADSPESYKLVTMRDAEINKSGNAIHMKGDYEKEDRVFWDGVQLMDDDSRTYDYYKGEGSVVFYFSDEFLGTVTDGDHELIICNGDEFTVMTVTAAANKLIGLKDKNLADYEELDWFDYYNLYAEYFAAYADIIYCDLDVVEKLLGDADLSGDVTILDATAIQRKLAAFEVDPFDEDAADADESGDLTILDATEIQRWLAGLPANANIGKTIA